MSPERIAPDRFGFKNSRPTISSDCYSLGMVIYETISGNLPFHKDTDPAVFMKIVEGKHPPRGVGFAGGLWGMLERCWASRPCDRPSIEDVLLCLEMTSNSSDPPSPRPIEGVDDDDDDWDSATNSSGGDSVDFFATEDHTQLAPIPPLQDHHLADSRRASLPPRYAPSASPSGVGNLPPPVFGQVKRPYTPDLLPPIFNQNTADSDYNNTFSNHSGSIYTSGPVSGSTPSSNLPFDFDLDLSNLSGFSAHDLDQLSAAFGFDSYSSFPDNSPTMPPYTSRDTRSNKRPMATLNSPTIDNHQQPPQTSSLGYTSPADPPRTPLPTLYSENPVGLSKSNPETDYRSTLNQTSWAFPQHPGRGPITDPSLSMVHSPPEGDPLPTNKIDAELIRIPLSLFPKLKQDLMIPQYKDLPALTGEEKVDSCILPVRLFCLPFTLVSDGQSLSRKVSYPPAARTCRPFVDIGERSQQRFHESATGKAEKHVSW